MAAVYGANMTKVIAESMADLPDTHDTRGRVKVAHDTYTAASLATGSTILVARLPENAKVANIQVSHTDWTGDTDLTLEVGDSVDSDRYITAQDVDAGAGSFNLWDDGVRASIFYQPTTAATRDILLTTGGSSAASGSVTVVVTYVVE